MYAPVAIGDLARDARCNVAANKIASMMFQALEHGFAPPLAELREWVTRWRAEAARVAATGPDPNLPPPTEIPT